MWLPGAQVTLVNPHVDSEYLKLWRPQLELLPRNTPEQQRVNKENPSDGDGDGGDDGGDGGGGDGGDDGDDGGGGGGLVWLAMTTTLWSSVLEGDQLTSDSSWCKDVGAHLLRF